MNEPSTSFLGDPPAAAEPTVMPDRRELALVAVERTRMPMVVTNPRRPDNPIVLANQAFLDLTGYTADEIIGRNCRFLQGVGTSDEDVDAIRRGIAAQDRSVSVELLNYRKDGTSFWNQLSISPVHDASGTLLYFFGSQKDVSARRRAQELEATERLLLMEVDHRAMNALSLVNSILGLTRTDSIERFAAAVRGRVGALARAHRLLAEAGWSGAQLGRLIREEIAPFIVDAHGPPVTLPPRLVQPLALVLHELVANAREHGALARNGGMKVWWEAGPMNIVLHWSEHGTSRPEPIPTLGLGLSLAHGVIERQLGGRITMDWVVDGLDAVLELPLASAERTC
ncbi:MAG: PAS domain-containing protein [Novosphingobium sp.]